MTPDPAGRGDRMRPSTADAHAMTLPHHLSGLSPCDVFRAVPDGDLEDRLEVVRALCAPSLVPDGVGAV